MTSADITEQFLMLLCALIADMLLGEPPARLHPVVWLGYYLAWVKRVGRGLTSSATLFSLGLMSIVFGVIGVAGLMVIITQALTLLPFGIRVLLGGLLLKPFFSIRMLLRAGTYVYLPLHAGDLKKARQQLSYHLVSRDTQTLSEAEVAGATVESLAENLTDSIIAPLLAFLCFGLAGAACYRMINTADAMLGYRRAELEYVGKPAARIDDGLNLLPARVSALLMCAAAAFLPYARAQQAWRSLTQDAHTTPSPNAGWTMAAAAGALGIMLDKRGVYCLNARGVPAQARDIRKVQGLIGLTLGLFMLLVSAGTALLRFVLAS